MASGYGRPGAGGSEAGEKLLLLLFSFSPAGAVQAHGGARRRPVLAGWPSWGIGRSRVYSCTYACTTYDEGHGAREARRERRQDRTEVRHETDRLERCDELRLTILRLRAPLRAAPRRRCAWPRCVVLPDPRRDVAFASAVGGLDSRRHIRVALSSSLADPLLSGTLRLAHLPSRSRLACFGRASYPSIPEAN